ncbi:TRAP-type transporter, 4TM/12TM fusion protein (Permease) [Desulfatibacillum aliphaticivorans]|uniref:TRAP-type transporter, 4TM/12TM fusion protein (Permease) n=1 Tax=Desulfatibacillum aliphaticivorans TaxID=218208 RepID=B8F9G5_DESAL|nr:TRAP transporter permease [Desulfatibacillum aliphaticivorans]ACL02911.1 TRAP-type transporter, 4TM/12TM fusion protein (Permease) [Desulfatibacillum aliphaticivorans]
MSEQQNLTYAQELLKAESGDVRSLRPFEKYLVGIIATGWAVFQMALAGGAFILDGTKTRAFHLAFAIALLFLLTPLMRKARKGMEYFFVTDRIPLMDYALAVIAVIASLYIVIDYDGLAYRAGMPITRDIAFGVVLVVVLLEAARRVIGPALSIIAIVFTVYAFLGPYMPDFLAFKGVSLRKYCSNISLSTEGIYGIPLGVSASIVYLFVLLGALLDKAGAGQFFTDLALSFLGKYKGGPAKAAVVASGATGLVSGSSIANIVTTGPFTIPLMKKVGYPAKKAAAVEVASSTDGQLMPPIMGAAAFIIAEYVNVPYIEVVKAAAIPAFASYFGLFCITHLEASKLGISGLAKHEVPVFFQTLKGGLHYLLPLGVLLYELIILRHSPEMAAFRAILILFVVIFYQELRRSFKAGTGIGQGFMDSIRIIGMGMIQGSKNMMPVALACAAAGIIVGVVNMGIGGMVAQIVETLSQGNIYLLLLITAIASLLLGMGLPTTATYIVMASLTAPIIVQVGGNFGFVLPLIAAHLFCFYFGILADDTPPVGLAAYAASAIADSDPIPTGIQGFKYDIRTSVIAFLFVFNPDLLLWEITSWPQAIMIFVMALIAMSAFECFAQNWCLIKNKWYDIPFFLAASFTLFHPGGVAHRFGVGEEYKYYFFLLGLAIYAIPVFMQSMRKRNLVEAA